MRHVDHEERADLIGDRPEPRKIDLPRIGRAPRNDQLRLVLDCQTFDLVVVDPRVIRLDPVGNRIKPFSGQIGLRPVGQVTARIERQTEKGIARLQQR